MHRRRSWVVALSLVVVACGARTELDTPEIIQAPSKKGPSDPVCGNGVLEQGEECDDGNLNGGDACGNTCELPRCGDGLVQLGEACDDGNTVDTDGCRNNCSLATCGNGTIEAGEECDSADPDACTPLCLLPRCGDGFLAPAFESCDAGPANEDRPAIVLIHDGSISEAVTPIRSVQSPQSFYGYESASAHTGFEGLRASNLFLFQETARGGLDLFTIHGIDLDSSGQHEGDARTDQSFSGLPEQAFVALSDEPQEFDVGGGSGFGQWNYHDNTDGGVIGGIPFPGDWIIEIDSTFVSGIDSWFYRDEKNGSTTLGGTHAVLQAFPTPSECRTDCTIPRCGDGILDGGEVCDDGNQSSGDGCSADCKSTEL